LKLKSKVKPIPEGYTHAIPYLIVRDASAAIAFYEKAFGGSEIFRIPGPDGKVMHSEIQIGESHLMIADEFTMAGTQSPSTLRGTPVGIFLYVKDVHAVFKKALAAGASQIVPPENMFWGDRFGKVRDPFGHEWQLATHLEDVSPEQMQVRMADAFSSQ
jgi:PhnB protein